MEEFTRKVKGYQCLYADTFMTTRKGTFFFAAMPFHSYTPSQLHLRNQSFEQCLITRFTTVCARSIKHLPPSRKTYMTRSFLKPVYIHRPNSSHVHDHPSALTLLSWALESNKSRFQKNKKTKTNKGMMSFATLWITKYCGWQCLQPIYESKGQPHQRWVQFHPSLNRDK